MQYKLDLLITMFLLSCGSIAVMGQARSTDNLLFTVPPSQSSHARAATNANLANPLTSIPAQAKQAVIMNFDTLPSADWFVNDCSGTGSGTVSHGILTINSPTCHEYILFEPKGIWNKYANNNRGWIVEAGLKVDPSTQPACDSSKFGSVQIWANDHTILVIVGFSTDEICLAYPDVVKFPMNTTDSFHIYRIEAKGMHIRVYVDGSLAIDHFLSTPGAGTQALSFGDGTIFNSSLTFWDYFSYDVFPSGI